MILQLDRCAKALWGNPHRSVAVNILFVILLVGCATPDLKPFADASKVLATSVNTGGDLAIKPIGQAPHWDGTKFISPTDSNHPAEALEKSWTLRRSTMDAVLVYSASLASIAEASANRKQNATELVGAVKQLASAVPGLSLGTNAAGDLLIFGLSTVVEVKAFGDMKQAVDAANPAIQLVAQALKKDFDGLSNLLQSRHVELITAKTNAARRVERVHQALLNERNTQRDRVVASPSDRTAGGELARLDGLIAAMEPELRASQLERAKLEGSMMTGKEFYAAAIRAVDSWASAHADLAKAFENNRSPNLVLLVARAEELKEIVDRLKK